MEKKFWESNPALGGYINWMIVGSALNASKVAPASLPGKARTLGEWSLDNLPHKMELLKQYLNTAHPAGARIDGGFTSSSSSRVVGSSGSNVSTVIYIHCEAGTDRTGEVSGSYYMKWQNKSFPEVRASCAMGRAQPPRTYRHAAALLCASCLSFTPVGKDRPPLWFLRSCISSDAHRKRVVHSNADTW